MANGTIESSTGTNLEIGVEWTSTANAAANSSTVTARVFLHHYQIYCAALTGSYVTVGESTEYFSHAVSSSSGGLQKTYIAERTFTVPHSSDGSKSVRIAAGYVFNGTYNGHYIGTLTVSGTATLDKIARASDFTLPTLTLTRPATVRIYPASSSYAHRAVMRVGNKSFSTSTVTGSTLSLTPPASLADGATGTKKASGTLTLETYSGGTKIGEVTKNCTYNIPETDEFLPDFTFSKTVTNSTSLLDGTGIIAASLSSLVLSVTGQIARHGAGVSSVKITFGAKTASTSTLSTGTLAAGTYTASAKIVDSRGMSRYKSESVTVVPYTEPYAESVDVHRCLSDGTASDSGAYLSAYAESKYTSLDSLNSAEMKLTLRSRGGVTLGEWALTPGQVSVIPAGLSAINSYTASVVVTDSAGGRGEYRVTVPTSKVDVHLKDGRLRIGGYAERQGVEVDWDARFNGDVSLGDDAISDFVTEQGRSGIWTWRKYASGASECYGTTAEKTYQLSANYGALCSSPTGSGSGLNSESYPAGLFLAPPCVEAFAARGSHAVIVAPRDAGSAAASPNYLVIYPTVPDGGSVSAALHICARGRYK